MALNPVHTIGSDFGVLTLHLGMSAQQAWRALELRLVRVRRRRACGVSA
jgi:hypothetical protein